THAGRTPLKVIVSLFGTWPFNSPVTRRKLRDGKPTPAPHRNAPVGASKLSGCPRTSQPPYADTSTSFAASLLTIASNATSALAVPTPLSALPVGALTITRTATAAGLCRNSDNRFSFTPRNRSPRLSPVHPWFTFG